MEKEAFEKLLLKTAFSCMVCDGEIDKHEVDMIKYLYHDTYLDSQIDAELYLNDLIHEINKVGFQFLKDTLNEISSSGLSEKEELKLVDFALKTIYSDFEVRYSELKFFKVLRSKLKLNNKAILDAYPNKGVFIEPAFDIIRLRLPEVESFLEEDLNIIKVEEELFNLKRTPNFMELGKIDEKLVSLIKDK